MRTVGRSTALPLTLLPESSEPVDGDWVCGESITPVDDGIEDLVAARRYEARIERHKSPAGDGTSSA